MILRSSDRSMMIVGTLPACGSLQVRLNNLGFRVTNRRLTSSTKTRDANKIRADPRQRKEKELQSYCIVATGSAGTGSLY